jgi:hypothetical protein
MQTVTYCCLLLTQLLTPLRPDVRIVTNQLLAEITELNRICIWVDPIADRSRAARFNSRGLRECLAWLQGGGLLVLFPAGAVSTIDVKRRGIVDPAWIPSAAWLARKTCAVTVPFYFSGSNSLPFHLLGLLHAKLRTAALPAEFLKKRGHPVEVRIGRPVPAATLDGFGDDRTAAEYLRSRTYLLGKRGRPAARAALGEGEPLAAPVSRSPRGRGGGVAGGQLLDESRELSVWYASAGQIPGILSEIGRLREATFRAVGEGCGRAIDLDRFDLALSAVVCLEPGAARDRGRCTGWCIPRMCRWTICTPARSSGSTAVSCSGSARRLSWAGVSCGRSISGSTRRCCCCGKASGSMSRAARRRPCCSARSASATTIRRFRGA